MIYILLYKPLFDIKLKNPSVSKIHYFGDGYLEQYKSKFYFVNMHHHKEDFGMECEWHFFATAHGKSSCDGVYGMVKRATARASPKRPFSNQ